MEYVHIHVILYMCTCKVLLNIQDAINSKDICVQCSRYMYIYTCTYIHVPRALHTPPGVSDPVYMPIHHSCIHVVQTVLLNETDRVCANSHYTGPTFTPPLYLNTDIYSPVS